MFFAAARELRGEKRTSTAVDDSSINIDSNREIYLGPAPSSRFPLRKSIDIVYPEFSSVRLADLIRVADPVAGEPPAPAVKKPRLDSTEPSLCSDSSKSAMDPTRESKLTKINTLGDLIKTFPDLEKMIDEEKTRQLRARVPLEYVREYVKPKIELKEVQPNPSNFSSFETPSAGLSTPAEQSKPVDRSGGGLLAGIDDLLGSSRKTKTSRSSRR